MDATTKIRAIVPIAATTGKIGVTNASGTGLTANDFLVLLPPTISIFSPASGPEGTQVTITGSSFSGATDVAFIGLSVSTFLLLSNTQIRATVPSGTTTGKITLTNVAGSGTSAEDFIITNLPGITSFEPTGATVGTEVTITGINFTGTTEVPFNGLSANISRWIRTRRFGPLCRQVRHQVRSR